MNNTKFATIVGQIRVLETEFIKDNQIERLVGSKNFQEAYDIMRELPRIKNIKDECDCYDFDYVLHKFLEEEKNFLEKNNPIKGSLDFIWYEYDAHNLKILLKSKVQSVPKKEYDKALYHNMGIIPIEKLENFVFNNVKIDNIDLPVQFYEYIDRAMRYYNEFQDVQVIDLTLDRMYLKIAMSLTAKYPILNDFIKKRIDFTNLKTFIRIKTLGELEKTHGILNKALIKKGYIDISFYEKYMDKTVLAFINDIPIVEYKNLFSIGYKSFEEENTFTLLEKLIDDYLFNKLHNTKYHLFGIEVVFAYFYVQKNLFRALRLILLGKMNNIDKYDILKRIRKLTL